MKSIHWALILLLAAASVGCSGKLDSSAAFASYAQNGAGTSGPAPRDTSSTRLDVGVPSGGSTAWSVESRQAGSGGSTKPDAAAACDFRGLIQMKCGNANCHGAPATNSGLDLTTAALPMRVAGRKGAGACTDHLLVDTEDPDQSKLYLKVTGTTCGMKMPIGGALTPSEQECVLSWIGGLPPQVASSSGDAGWLPDAGWPVDAGSPVDAGWVADAGSTDAGWLPDGSVLDASSAAGAPADVGQGGSGGSPAKPDAGPACDFRGLIQMKCGNASCHGAPAMNTGLDLTSASLATRVAGRKGAGACTSNLLIDKDYPEQSKLYLKVTGTSCGTKMPVGGSLTAGDQQCILSWIEGL